MTALNKSAAFAGDVANYIQERTLTLTRRQLVLFQFGDQIDMPTNMGTQYQGTRYSRLPLPIGPLAEAVPSIGESLTISTVTATAQQWGDLVAISDVTEITISHDIFKKAVRLVSLQIAETYERNTVNALMAGTNVFYANGKTSRANLLATDVLTPVEVSKAVGSMEQTGVPMFMGGDDEDLMIMADTVKGGLAKTEPHYVAVINPLPSQDLRQNAQVVNAWSYSEVNRLYINEIGAYGGFRWTKCNMIPSYTGAALITGTAASGGSFPSGAYVIMVTEVNPFNGYEQIIHQLSGTITLTTNQAISVVLPAATVSGYTFNIYVSLAGGSNVNNIGLSPSGPLQGTFAGYSIGLAPSQTVLITGAGPTIAALAGSATPTLLAPAPPATGVVVYPTFFIGESAYGQVTLDTVRIEYLKNADKSDPQNQLRIISWKSFYGTIILNPAFFLRVESGSAYTNLITNGVLN